MSEIRYLPPHCLECRVQWGGGSCESCKARWQEISGMLRKVVLGLADHIEKEKKERPQ